MSVCFVCINIYVCLCSCNLILSFIVPFWGFLGGSVIKDPLADSRVTSLIPGSEQSPEIGNGNPLQYSCLVNPLDRGALRATVHGIARSRIQLRDDAHITFLELKKKKNVIALDSAVLYILQASMKLWQANLLAWNRWKCQAFHSSWHNFSNFISCCSLSAWHLRCITHTSQI